jgi:CheY-specific phosphatase CheX
VKTTQQVLFAQPMTPRLTKLGPALNLADMSVSVAPSFDAAARIVQALPTLALVVIDACDCPAEATSLLARIRDCNRRLPVLWVGPAPLGGVERPDACVPEQTRPLELIECALDLLVDELYPPALVRSFLSACNVALTTTFEVAVDCEQPRLSRAAVRPGDVSALMLLSDHDTTAHLILSSSEAVLFGLAERIGFDAIAGRHQLAIDMASELTNQIAGRLKATSDVLATMRLTLPYVVTGEAFSIHSPTPKPSLMVQLELGGEPLSVNFWWKTRRQHDAEAERVLAELTAGDGLF